MMPGRQIILLCLLCLTPAANAEVYTWTDEKGTRHFSDTAPAAVEPKPASFGPVSVIPMAGSIRQSEKVSAIHRKIQQSLERDRPAQRASDRDEESAAQKSATSCSNGLRTSSNACAPSIPMTAVIASGADN